MYKRQTQKYKEDPRYMCGTELDMSDPRFQSEDLGDNSMKASEYGIKKDVYKRQVRVLLTV